MRLSNLSPIDDQESVVDLKIRQGKIESISPHDSSVSNSIVFDNAVVFPGLINSHDHLDFNLFPQLKVNVHYDYLDWGKAIHSNFKEEIDRINQIPDQLRGQWGILKNLINGFTTVVDHSFHAHHPNGFVDVVGDFNFIHAIGTHKNWKLKLNNFLNHRDVMLHIGEGITEGMSDEIDQFIKWNLLGKSVIGIHCIAMNTKQAEHFKALVWCPDSNKFLFNKTAPIDQLKHHVTILFGTDSSLSASSLIWEHLKEARILQLLNDEELFHSLTANPARIFGLNNQLKENASADLVIAKRKTGKNSWDNFYSINPEDFLLIVNNGQIKLFDSSIEDQIDKSTMNELARIKYSTSRKFIEKGAVLCIKELEKYQVPLPLPISIDE